MVDTPGDNVLSEFSSVVDTVQRAVETRRQLRSRNAGLPGGCRMQFASGSTWRRRDFETRLLYGDGVNIAARRERLAEAPYSDHRPACGGYDWVSCLGPALRPGGNGCGESLVSVLAGEGGDHLDFTQELPRKLLPTRTEVPQTTSHKKH